MKYMGSKARHAKHILPIILKDRKPDQWYVEPFVGGANVIDKVDGKRIGADSNEYLISFYEYLQQGGEVPELHIDSFGYKHIKENMGLYKSWYVGMIGFCYSYGAKFFGGFIGNSKDVVCEGRDRMGESYRAAVGAKKQVKGVNLFCCSYLDLLIPPNSLIYCDPPYEKTTGYKDKFDHDQFWQWCRDKRAEGHTIFVSEYNAPDDFVCVWEKEVNSSLTKDTGAKKATEKLFTL